MTQLGALRRTRFRGTRLRLPRLRRARLRRARLRHAWPRRGLALPAALLALTLIALFLAGSAFVSLQEARSASNALGERRALEAAEYGVAAVLRDWDPRWNLAVAPGDTLGPWVHTLAGGAASTVRAVRATPTTVWVVSEGTTGIPAADRRARRVVGALLRLDPGNEPFLAAITVRDSLAVTGSGSVSGADSLPAVADPFCQALPAPVAGAGAPDTTRICDGACGSAGGLITGAPRLLADATAADPRRYAVPAPGAWSALAGRADIVLPPNAVITPGPVVTGGACQRTAPGNWGDPAALSPCAAWLPVIHAVGDVTIMGGVGQGILLAEGDVRIDGGARFSGVIVANDDVHLTAGAVVLGAVRAGDARTASGDHSHVANGARVRYSSCAVTRAQLGAALLRRVRQRWWVELF